MSSPQTPTDNNAQLVRDMLVHMCPEPMREMFVPMVEMAIAQMPADYIASLAADLETALDESGEPDVQKLIVVGKKFGLTDEMIAGYQASFSALS